MWRAIAVLVIGAALSAEAKCIRENYHLVGQVTGRDGGPIAGASVIVSWGGNTKWNSGTESTRSARDGSFAVVVPFDTLSSDGPKGDICEGRLKSATVEVAASGYRPKRAVVPFDERKANVVFVLEQPT